MNEFIEAIKFHLLRTVANHLRASIAMAAFDKFEVPFEHLEFKMVQENMENWVQISYQGKPIMQYKEVVVHVEGPVSRMEFVMKDISHEESSPASEQ